MGAYEGTPAAAFLQPFLLQSFLDCLCPFERTRWRRSVVEGKRRKIETGSRKAFSETCGEHLDVAGPLASEIAGCLGKKMVPPLDASLTAAQELSFLTKTLTISRYHSETRQVLADQAPVEHSTPTVVGAGKDIGVLSAPYDNRQRLQVLG